MGSGSSKEAPKETQSAPATARATPKQPKRNRQFEEVQIAGQGGSRSRAPARSTGASPNPHQSSSTTKTPRGTDPGASGSTSERGKAQNTPRQGAAANGRKVIARLCFRKIKLYMRRMLLSLLDRDTPMQCFI